MSFRPERFLGDEPERDPRDSVFGLGRRVCPGKLLPDSSVWLTVAKSLSALRIEKVTGPDGRLVEPKVRFTAGVVSHPVPFRASITARSSQYEDLITSVEKTDLWVQGMSEALAGLE